MAKRKRRESTSTPSAADTSGRTEADSPPPFDEAFAKLHEIVDRLESGSQGLEESLAEFEDGIGLLRTCTRILDDADQRIAILTGFDAEGRPREEPFDAAATHAAAIVSEVSSPRTLTTDGTAESAEDSESLDSEASTNEPSPREGGSHPARELFR